MTRADGSQNLELLHEFTPVSTHYSISRPCLHWMLSRDLLESNRCSASTKQRYHTTQWQPYGTVDDSFPRSKRLPTLRG